MQKAVKAHLKPGKLARRGTNRNGGIQKLFHREKLLSKAWVLSVIW
jgi:hypothetical protein